MGQAYKIFSVYGCFVPHIFITLIVLQTILLHTLIKLYLKTNELSVRTHNGIHELTTYSKFIKRLKRTLEQSAYILGHLSLSPYEIMTESSITAMRCKSTKTYAGRNEEETMKILFPRT